MLTSGNVITFAWLQQIFVPNRKQPQDPTYQTTLNIHAAGTWFHVRMRAQDFWIDVIYWTLNTLPQRVPHREPGYG
jgi:hypothetical protein